MRDVTGGALTYTNATYPGAFFKDQFPYLAVSGRVVRGRNMRKLGEPKEERSLQTYASGSYEQVCGVGDDVVGDCVVPNSYAFLHDAENIMLDGVFHSMSKVGTYEDETPNRWYGSSEVVDVWLGHMVQWKV